jgi:hypothetical protein
LFTIIAICIVLALCFGVAWLHLRGTSPALAAVAWILYPPYEFWIRSRCTGECNIRVDLLLIAPFLLVVSILAAISLVRSNWRKRKGSREPAEP